MPENNVCCFARGAKAQSSGDDPRQAGEQWHAPDVHAIAWDRPKQQRLFEA